MQKSYKRKPIAATSVATCEILDKLEVQGVVGVPKTDSYSIPKRYENAESVGSPMAPIYGNHKVVKTGYRFKSEFSGRRIKVPV